MDRWKRWIGKRVYIELASGRKYTGKVSDVEPTGERNWVTIKDKYGHDVCFVDTEVTIIQEEN